VAGRLSGTGNCGSGRPIDGRDRADLDEFSANHPQLRVVHVRELPAGWLGKPHALQMAYEASSGEWLVFTDADVKFRPDALRRVVALARARGMDHLALLGDVERSGFWDTVLITFFGMGFQLAADLHAVSNPNSRAYVGVGAFQMLKRGAYKACGTHRRLAMEVIDDMKLGKLVKRTGVSVGRGDCAGRGQRGVASGIGRI